MKESPILFTTDMVQANLDGRKTMTRRIKGLEEIPVNEDVFTKYEYKGLAEGLPNTHCFARLWRNNWVETYHAHCPYGIAGDILWVRENFLKPPVITYKMLRDGADTWPKIDYQASCSEIEIDQYKSWGWKLKPSIHMPKDYARIWLQIINIRVERLRDITEEDAKNEGIQIKPYGSPPFFCTLDYSCKPAKNGFIPGFCADTGAQFRESFKTLWESINGSHSWWENPWVWVISFKVLSTTGKPETFQTIYPIPL